MNNLNVNNPNVNRRWWLLLLVPTLFVAWALFRPELIFVNKSVNEALPAATAQTNAAPKKLLTGEFGSLAHQTAGTASVFELPDGKKTLRLADFHTSNGPDVHVYLVAGADGKDNKTINGGGFIDLGVIKGNIGDQNYDLPADVDLTKYRGVSIWCKRFAVNFGGAALADSGQ